MDEETENNEDDAAITPIPRRATFARGRGSDVGTSIPSPSKRASIGGASKLPKRQSIGLNAQDSGIGMGNVKEGYDLNETF